MFSQVFYTVALSICSILLGIILILVLNSKRKNSMHITFSFVILCLMICCLGQLASLLFAEDWNLEPVYFDYFVYIGTCFLPVTFLFFGMSFAKSRFKFKKKYLLLFIIPIITLLVIWTNDFHHLFYEDYSVNTSETVFGPYFFIHSTYTYGLFAVDIIMLLMTSIKNSSFLSKQSILIVLGTLVPIIVNVVGMTVLNGMFIPLLYLLLLLYYYSGLLYLDITF